MLQSVFRLMVGASRHDILKSSSSHAVLGTQVIRFKSKAYLFDRPDEFKHTEMPERPKLRVLPKVPQISVRPPKMIKNLKFMRGPELVHNTLLYKQFGIVALTGGRLRFGHLESIRMNVARRIDASRMFAVWRIEDPWQPVSKKGIGKRHGGGKGAIDHYVTPIKAGRVIIEIAGMCVFEEVKPMLDIIANNLPFKSRVVDQRLLMAEKKLEELEEESNINPYTYKYLIMNRMAGSQNWVKPMDRIYFGKYV